MMDQRDILHPGGRHVHDLELPAAAKAVQRDFAKLVTMFDRQLAGLRTGDGAARAHFARARSAAEHGLRLSLKLIETLRH
jgi:hypothetical protein